MTDDFRACSGYRAPSESQKLWSYCRVRDTCQLHQNWKERKPLPHQLLHLPAVEPCEQHIPKVS